MRVDVLANNARDPARDRRAKLRVPWSQTQPAPDDALPAEDADPPGSQHERQCTLGWEAAETPRQLLA
jgi:hypothetical protein